MTVAIQPLCAYKVSKECKQCPECKIDRSMGLINDDAVILDEFLLNHWMNKIKEELRRVAPSLLQLAKQWYREKGRRVIFVSYYSSIFDMVHNTNLLVVPEDVLQVYFDGELAPYKIAQKMSSDVHVNPRPFNPEAHIAVLIRVQVQMYNSLETAQEIETEQEKEDEQAAIEGAEGVKDVEVDEDAEVDSDSRGLFIVLDARKFN